MHDLSDPELAALLAALGRSTDPEHNPSIPELVTLIQSWLRCLPHLGQHLLKRRALYQPCPIPLRP